MACMVFTKRYIHYGRAESSFVDQCFVGYKEDNVFGGNVGLLIAGSDGEMWFSIPTT